MLGLSYARPATQMEEYLEVLVPLLVKVLVGTLLSGRLAESLTGRRR